MSVETVQMYRLICDWPDCEVSAQDDGDFHAWAEESSAIEEASNNGWHESHDGKSWYCEDHPTTWASDHEDGETYPAPPYLLIHDGDECPLAECQGDSHVVLVTDVTP